jgi:hypothetical protein
MLFLLHNGREQLLLNCPYLFYAFVTYITLFLRIQSYNLHGNEVFLRMSSIFNVRFYKDAIFMA